MPTTDDLARRLQSAMMRGQFTDWRKMYTGRRTSTGITLAGADTGKTWVRAEEDSREETQVWGSASRVNLPVWVGPNIAGELELKTLEQTEAAMTAGAAAAASLLPTITPENSPNILIDGRQFRPGRLRLSDLGGLYVYVEPFQYDGGYWPGGNLALTPPGTANQQAWCVVAFDPATGTLSQFTGAEYALPVLLGGSELAQVNITAGYIPLGGVVLQNGQTAITGAEVWGDLRYHFAQAGGDISGVVILAPTSATRNTVQPVGDHPALILKNSGSQTDAPFQVQTSAGAVMIQANATGGLIVNEQGADADTRIEGDTDANLVFVDASTDRVGIGTNAPAAKFSVSGASSLDGAVTINDAGADVDFRVEGDTAANLIFADASLDAVGINQSSIATSAVLDIASTTKGMLIPRVTTTQRDAISSPAAGLLVYNTSTSAFNFYNGSSWAAVGGGGAGSLTVKEADGTPTASGVDTIVLSNGVLTDDGGGQVTIAIAGGSTPYSLCQGRLTLTTGVPVTTSDVTAATTVYFTPYGGNQIGLYSGSSWNLFAFSEISLSLSGYTADKNYDIWAYDNSGTVTLDSTVWTNDTTRATALTTQDGVYVKTGATTRRYLGTIRITGTTGQCEDSLTKRFVWNYYNRANRPLVRLETTSSWTYSTASFRQANGSSTNQVDVVVGVAESVIELNVDTLSQSSAGSQIRTLAIGEDSTSAAAANCMTALAYTAAADYENMTARLVTHPAIGRHYYAWLEYGNGSGTQTWYGVYAPFRQYGMTGAIDA